MKEHNLFVYGTLKSGFHNNHLLKDAKLKGIYCTQPNFDLWPITNTGRFPVMIKGSFRVLGEMYKVNDKILNNCDQLEGHPSFYKRTIIKLLDGPLCFTYLFPFHPIDWKSNTQVTSQHGITEFQRLKEWTLK